ncbi:hypothetical protein PIB30_050207 [Stylosanthes scabra]|uniref:Uncharacterized protein n=1 Tax=Stylosanthes scabra TaxID=79078 RepID=A0ABU6VGN9_9FABA|nr:hypothetical protein [Stylosanthes scabra]
MQDVAYHLGLHTDGDPISGCVRDFRVWYGTDTWEMAEEYLGGRPPAGGGKNYAGVKITWLRQRVQMTPGYGAPPDVLQQYARCYVMMMIEGRLFPRQDQQHRVAAHSIVGLGRSVLEIPPPLHREQARQHGDERVSAAGVIMDIPGIPTLLSTRQKRHGVPSCFTA